MEKQCENEVWNMRGNIRKFLSLEMAYKRAFVRECGGADHVWYSCAAVSGGETERKRVEAALIYELQPKINTSGKDSFNYPTTVVNSRGRHAYIPEQIVAG